ncbi:hypothetical protein ACP26L_08635 [Paenibacillus sp. S-38]|uniref:hypothetical protein n=1 Tax=Paenibacillus sp. S-38 TaxID=3416710 RepID=UPI003CE8CB16
MKVMESRSCRETAFLHVRLLDIEQLLFSFAALLSPSSTLIRLASVWPSPSQICKNAKKS